MKGKADQQEPPHYDEALSRQFAELIRSNQLNKDVLKRLFGDRTEVNICIESQEFNAAIFDGLELPRMKLRKVKFIGCTFAGTTWPAEFEDVEFLEGPMMSRAIFANATFTRCRFVRADMRGCDFSHTQFKDTTLEHCTAIESIFVEAKCTNLLVSGGSLDRADLDGASGLVLDDVSVRDVFFPLRCDDPWSVLRRTYTGPAMAFHLIAVIIFFGGLAAKAMMWQMVNRMQTLWSDTMAEAVNRCIQFADDRPEVVELCEFLQERLEHLDPSSSKEFQAWQTWQVLLALDKGWLWSAFAIAILIYNLVRVLLTRQVSFLREEEERTRRVPPLKEYGYLTKAHKVVRVLFGLAVISLILSLASLLLAPVFLPR